MVNLKKWMANVTKRLKTLALISYKDYSGTTGTTQYGGYYFGDLDVSIDGKTLVGFSVQENKTNMPVFLIRTRVGTIRAFAPEANYTITVRCIYLGGNILFTPLNRIAQILLRKEVGVC